MPAPSCIFWGVTIVTANRLTVGYLISEGFTRARVRRSGGVVLILSPAHETERIKVDAGQNHRGTQDPRLDLQGEPRKARFQKPYEQSRYVVENNGRFFCNAVM